MGPINGVKIVRVPKNPSHQNSKCQKSLCRNDSVPTSPHVEKCPRCQNIPIPKCSCAKNSSCWKFPMPKIPHVEMFPCWNIHVPEHPQRRFVYVPKCLCDETSMLKCSDVHQQCLSLATRQFQDPPKDPQRVLGPLRDPPGHFLKVSWFQNEFMKS